MYTDHLKRQPFESDTDCKKIIECKENIFAARTEERLMWGRDLMLRCNIVLTLLVFGVSTLTKYSSA